MADRLIDFPEEPEVAPDYVFEQLREIDARAEVICIGNGIWWAGRVKPLSERVQRGHQQLLTYEKLGWEKKDPLRWPKIRNSILMTQGFGIVCKHRFGLGEKHWSALIEDFRFRIWHEREHRDGTVEMREEIEGLVVDDMTSRARARIVDRYEADRAYIFKRKLRQDPAPVTVGADLI